jgi:general secretion pathway protein J
LRATRNNAFTLLEVMLAITILALVMTSVYATWNAGLSGWRRTTNVGDALQRQRIVMDTLSGLCSSIYYTNSDIDVYVIIGERSHGADSVSFITSSDVLLPPSEFTIAGMRRVTLSLERDRDGHLFLAIANEIALKSDNSPEPVKNVLSADVSGFTIRYRDPRDDGWKEEWKEKTLIPSALEFTIAFGETGGRTPPIVMTRTVELPLAQAFKPK